MDERTYHHGDLPAALMGAVDQIVRDQGAAGVSLREVARRAGVSHAAPAHHFGDKAGLLSAYAAEGFALLREQLVDASRSAEADDGPNLFAIGLAYVRFALEEPGRFTVMFRPEAVHADQPLYRESCDAAFAVLDDAVRRLRTDLEPDDPELLAAATGAWSIVHGFATLWLDGNLDEAVTSMPSDDAAAAVMGAFGSTLFMAAGLTPPPVPPH
jgi:AcrR family transcriptional regulator